MIIENLNAIYTTFCRIQLYIGVYATKLSWTQTLYVILENQKFMTEVFMKDENILLMKEIQKRIKEYKIKENAFQKKYGHIRKIVHGNTKDYKCIAVGKTILADKQWITFPDFLMDYLKIILGKEWWKLNINKTEPKQHPIIVWHRKMLEFQKKQKINDNGIYEAEANAPMLSFILLAYDLYTIAHNFELQNQVIKRLKNYDQFQGARFELFVASTFIRAGFLINYSDESDRSKKHPEFIAEIPKTGQVIAVEAKSRHRSFTHSEKSENKKRMKFGIIQLINRALKKSPDQPFIIFIDLNLPVTKKHQPSNFKQLVSEYKKSYNKKNISDKFNLIFFTDHNPCSFNDNSAALRFCEPFVAISKNPKFEMVERAFILSRLKKSISQFVNIPNSFSEMDFDHTINLDDK